MIKVFLISKSYQVRSTPCIFQTNFRILVYISICNFAYISLEISLQRKLASGLSVIKVLASFSKSIRCFVNDGLILTCHCLTAFLIELIFSLNEWDLNFMMVFYVLLLPVFPLLWSLPILLAISFLDIPVSHNISLISSFNLFEFSFFSLHNLVRTMQDLLEYISNSSVLR